MLLVIPVEDKPSWRRLPLVCITLIIVNLLVFGLLDPRDSELFDQAMTTYEDADLVDREWPLYLDYLEETDLSLWSDLSAVPEDERAEVATRTLFYDRGFDARLRTIDAFRQDGEWQAARQRFEEERNETSAIRFGLTPGDMQVDDLFTHMFMHGSWDHVIGNMLFLALFGVALEARLGHLLLLVLYVCSGLAASLAHAMTDRGSMLPMVGASGAVAGLMGMYVGMYGTKPREFIVMIGPWLGSLRMPALVVFPLWLGKEILGGVLDQDNVAYWAHAGGLLAGLLLVQPFRRRAAQAEAHPDPAQGPAQTGAGNATGTQAVLSPQLQQLSESGQFEKVMATCETRLARNPGDRQLWVFYLDNAARSGPTALLHAAGRLLATLNAPAPDYGTAAHAWLHLRELRADLSKLSPAHRLLLCELQLHMSRYDEALATLTPLLDGAWRHPRLTRTAQALAARLPDAGAARELSARATSLAQPPAGQ